MAKLFSFVFAVALACPATAVKATPFTEPNRSSLILLVADGCGFNKYRDARGVCRTKYVLGRYRKTPLYGTCGGLNSHRVCNLYGQCWIVCD